MTAPSIARSPRTQPGAVAAAPRRGLPRPLMLKLASSARLVRSLGAATMVVAMIGLIELFGTPAGIEPAVLLPLLVAGAAFAFGVSGALVAGVPGAAYAVVYYGQPDWSSVDGNGVRVLAAVLVSGFAAWLVVLLRDRIEIANADVAAQHEHNRAVVEFATVLANEAPDSVPEALVAGASRLFEADMCVLTILDPPSGRHVVRAVHGTAASALGIEIVPGVGITGQAIRDRKLVSAGNASQKQGRQTTAALPVLQAGRVVATLTIGRSNGRPFDDHTTWAIDQVVPIIGLAVTGTLARNEVEQGSPRDPTTGLYNRAYLDAALQQLIALRRRLPPEERSPLSMILFDIDSFRLLNERHGRQVGDLALRAVATLLRQRFRASDIIARVGPDSFVIVMSTASAEVAADAAAQIRRQVRELALANASGEPVVVSVSGGCAMFRDGEPPETLFRSVEAALETARWSGPGAVVSI